MKDAFGNLLQVGDTVLYSTKDYHTPIYIVGKIIGFRNKTFKVEVEAKLATEGWVGKKIDVSKRKVALLPSDRLVKSIPTV